jgi:prolyl-tRNA synthetase
MAAAIEANHDQNGIQWPWNIAPYEVIVIPVNVKNPSFLKNSDDLYQNLLTAGYEAVWDDREVSAGYKFNEADLIGFPLQVIVGEKTLKNGLLEIKIRTNGKRIEFSQDQLLTVIKKLKDELLILHE